MSDLAESIRSASPEQRAELRAALDAVDRAEADADQLSQEQLKGMTHEQVLEAHKSGRLRKLTAGR